MYWLSIKQDKVSTKSLECVWNHYFGSYFGKWDALYCILLQFFLIYNATLFGTIASCRIEILHVYLKVMGSGNKYSTSVVIRTIHNGIDWNYHLECRIEWLNSGVSSNDILCSWAQILARFIPDPTTSSRQYLSSQTGYVYKWGTIVKQKKHTLQ